MLGSGKGLRLRIWGERGSLSGLEGAGEDLGQSPL